MRRVRAFSCIHVQEYKRGTRNKAVCDPLSFIASMLIFPRRIVVDGIAPCPEEVKHRQKSIEKFVSSWERRCEETIPNGAFYSYRTSSIPLTRTSARSGDGGINPSSGMLMLRVSYYISHSRSNYKMAKMPELKLTTTMKKEVRDLALEKATKGKEEETLP